MFIAVLNVNRCLFHPELGLFLPPQNPDMLTRKIKLCHINAHITCRLCEGYLIDATTVTECLHTCRSLPSLVPVFLSCCPPSSCFCFIRFSCLLEKHWLCLSLRIFLGSKGLTSRIYPRRDKSWRQSDAPVIFAALFLPAFSLTSLCIVYFTTSSVPAVFAAQVGCFRIRVQAEKTACVSLHVFLFNITLNIYTHSITGHLSDSCHHQVICSFIIPQIEAGRCHLSFIPLFIMSWVFSIKYENMVCG